MADKPTQLHVTNKGSWKVEVFYFTICADVVSFFGASVIVLTPSLQLVAHEHGDIET